MNTATEITTATASFVRAHGKLPSRLSFLLLPLPLNLCRLVRRFHSENRAAKRGARMYEGPIVANRDIVAANLLGWKD